MFYRIAKYKSGKYGIQQRIFKHFGYWTSLDLALFEGYVIAEEYNYCYYTTIDEATELLEAWIKKRDRKKNSRKVEYIIPVDVVSANS